MKKVLIIILSFAIVFASVCLIYHYINQSAEQNYKNDYQKPSTTEATTQELPAMSTTSSKFWDEYNYNEWLKSRSEYGCIDNPQIPYFDCYDKVSEYNLSFEIEEKDSEYYGRTIKEIQEEYSDVFYISDDNPDFVISNYKDGLCIHEYLGKDTTIHIPDKIDGKPVIKIGIRFEIDSTGDGSIEVSAVKARHRTAVYIGKNIKEIAYFSFTPWYDYYVDDHCEPLVSIDVDKDNPYYSSQDGILYNKGKDMLLAIPYGNCEETVFIDKNIKYVSNWAIPNQVKTIIGYSGSYAEEYAKENGLKFKAIE